jgi:hypothetical protein
MQFPDDCSGREVSVWPRVESGKLHGDNIRPLTEAEMRAVMRMLLDLRGTPVYTIGDDE